MTTKYHPFNFKVATFYKGVKRVREPDYLTVSKKIEDNNNHCILIAQRIKKNEAFVLGKSKSYLNIGDVFYDKEKNTFYVYSFIKEKESNGVKMVGFEKILISENNSVIQLKEFLKRFKTVESRYIGNIFTDKGIENIMFYTIRKYNQKNYYKNINKLRKIIEIKRKTMLDVYFLLNIKNNEGVMSYTYDSIFHKPKLMKIINGWDIILSYVIKKDSYELEGCHLCKPNKYFYSTTGTLIHFNNAKKELLINDKQYKDIFQDIETKEEYNELFQRTKDMLIMLNDNGDISYYSFIKDSCYLLNESSFLFNLNCELYEHINYLQNKGKFEEVMVSLI